MIKKFFKFILCSLFLFFMISCKPVSEFLEPIDYIEIVKTKEISSQNYYNNKAVDLETFVYDFFKTNYDNITRGDIVWEEKGKLENGKLIRASYKDAYVDIKAIKDGDFINIETEQLDFRDSNGNKYNISNIPFNKAVASKKENNSSESSSSDINSNNKINMEKQEIKEKEDDKKTANNDYISKTEYSNVVNGKYVGGDFIQAVKNAKNIEDSEYLKEQFYKLMENMYVTKDKITYYYLTDIVSKLAEKADTNIPVRDDLRVEGKKLYYLVLFPKDFGVNTPSWVEFEIFQKKFDDGIELRTAHVRCAINNVEYKDWEAIAAIYR